MSQINTFLALARKAPLTNNIILLIFLSYPALLLTVRGGMGVCFFLLFIVSCISLYHARSSLSRWDKYCIAFSLSMASPIVAIFLSEASHGVFKAPSYDGASRFLLSIPIFLALRRGNIHILPPLQLGISLGVLVGFLTLKLHPAYWAFGRYTTSLSFNLIHFGDTALMLGFLSLFSINMYDKEHILLKAIKLCGFIAGVYMSIQSGERGSWIAIPLLLFLWVALRSKSQLFLKLVITMLAVSFIFWLCYSMIDVIHNRVDLIFSDLHSYANGNKDTSVGIRFQLYLAALHLFFENPLFGVGPGGFSQAMPELISSGMLTPLAGMLGSSEVHNEILAKCAETGLFGLLSILSIYIVPSYIFWKARHATDSSIRIASAMGLSLILGFFIFGLTVEIFDLKMTTSFFALTLAILMARVLRFDVTGNPPIN